jgi:hypothetical protein
MIVGRADVYVTRFDRLLVTRRLGRQRRPRSDYPRQRFSIQARWCPVQDDEHRSGKICRQRAQQLADGCDPPAEPPATTMSREW